MLASPPLFTHQPCSLQRRLYPCVADPDAVFLGARHSEELAEIYAAADVFVFPSKTDTFGLVLLEALASGLPVAAFPVTGPRDVIGKAPVGVHIVSGRYREDLCLLAGEAIEAGGVPPSPIDPVG